MSEEKYESLQKFYDEKIRVMQKDFDHTNAKREDLIELSNAGREVSPIVLRRTDLDLELQRSKLDAFQEERAILLATGEAPEIWDVDNRVRFQEDEWIEKFDSKFPN